MSGKYVSLADLKEKLAKGGMVLSLENQAGTLSGLALRTIEVTGTPGDKADVTIDHNAAGGAKMTIR